MERLVIPKARPDRLEDWRVGPEDRVAIHTGLGWRNPGERGLLDRRMAVAAVDPLAAHVVRVAELDGLLDDLVLFGDPRGPHQRVDDPTHERDKRERANQAHSRDGVGTAWEDL